MNFTAAKVFVIAKADIAIDFEVVDMWIFALLKGFYSTFLFILENNKNFIWNTFQCTIVETKFYDQHPMFPNCHLPSSK